MSLCAQTVDDAVRTLASHVPEWIAPRTNVTVQCTNRSQTKEVEFAPVCRAFARELQRVGHPAGSGGPVIALTASDSVTGRLLVAHLDSPDGPKAAMIAWSNSAPQSPASTGRMRIERSVVMESDTPILDFALMQGGSTLAVLEPAAVNLYTKNGAGWELVRRDLLPSTRPLPRDVRGRLIATSAGGLSAYLPGMECTTDDAANRPFTCSAGDSGWAVAPGAQARWAANRNYLKTELGPVYTIAPISADRYIVTSVDGPMRIASGRGEPAATAAGYGSDAAVVEADCGTFAVATRATDAADPDQLIVLDPRNNRLDAGGAVASVPGPVTALWPSDKRTEAHAVVRNAGTGIYEASRVAISCTQ